MSQCQNAQAPGMQTKNGQTVAALRKEVPWCLGEIEFTFWYFLQMQTLPFAALECDTYRQQLFLSSGNGIDEQHCQSTGTLRNPQTVSKNLSQVPLDVIQWLFHTPKTSWKTFTKLGPLCWCRVAYVCCFLFTWTNVWIVRTPCSLRLAQILMHHYQILPAIFGADELHEWRNLSRQKICTMCPKIQKMVYSPTNKAIPLWN